MRTSRRRLLKSAIAAGIVPALSRADAGWSGGRVRYLMPMASHDRFIIKAVFAQRATPSLAIDGRQVPGRQTDSAGTAFTFDVDGLASATAYELRLMQGDETLSEPWPLKTYPAPDAEPEHLRLLVYTCAGGHPLMSEGEASVFQPMSTRRALLQRGLSYQPDAAIAIGDQLYWDQRTWLESANPARNERTRTLFNAVGMLDRNVGALGTPNEELLKIVGGEQIAPLYGTTMRSTPTYFLSDDHDYFENDEATERFVTLPPYEYQWQFANYIRDLYLPAFIRTPDRAEPLSGDLDGGLNSSFGTLRWGQLAEVLMYDCAGHLSLKGPTAGLVPGEVERWLTTRTRDERVRQLVHIPSHPFGWSAGKWREWYPDVADTGAGGAQIAQIGTDGKQFKLTTDKPKYMWQPGWWAQHQRLLGALSGQQHRPGVVLSGDLHAIGHAQITASGDANFGDKPVNTVITGPIGTGTAWPSQARGTPPLSASDLTMTSPAPIQEKNGFTIVDLTADEVRLRLFAWRREEQGLGEIGCLEPYHDVTLARGG